MNRRKLKVIAYSLIVLWQEYLRKKRLRRLAAYRINPYLRERNIKGRYFKDFEDLKNHSIVFNENFHMDVNTFQNLFLRIEERLVAKRNTRRDEISPKQTFSTVIEYLASGTLQRHVSSIYRISEQYFGTMIDLVCDAICEELKDDMPDLSAKSSVNIANGFNTIWNFANCIGAICRRKARSY